MASIRHVCRLVARSKRCFLTTSSLKEVKRVPCVILSRFYGSAENRDFNDFDDSYDNYSEKGYSDYPRRGRNSMEENNWGRSTEPRNYASFRNPKFGHGSFSRRDSFSEYGSKDWKMSEKRPSKSIPLVKDVYIESKHVQSKTPSQLMKELGEMDIKIKGVETPKPISTLDDIVSSLPDSLKYLLQKDGIDTPFPIQKACWPIVMSGRDCIGIARTGSGKTLSFVLPALLHILQNRSLAKPYSPQVLIVTPTRELCQQVAEIAVRYGKAFKISTGMAFGGANRFHQLQSLEDASICVATPGRLMDFVNSGSLHLDHCSFLVLDEADRMLDMGFEPQIRSIESYIRDDKQCVMFSATWPMEIRSLANRFTDNPVLVRVGSEELMANPNIIQKFYSSIDHSKGGILIELLQKIIRQTDVNPKTLIFVQTKKQADNLERLLRREGIPCQAIHGDKSQNVRDKIYREFKTRQKCVLIATDIASRGLDVTDIGHIINFDLPGNIETYIHRIGRTARADRKGYAHSLLGKADKGVAKNIQKALDAVGHEGDKDLEEFLSKVSEPIFAVGSREKNYKIQKAWN